MVVLAMTMSVRQPAPTGLSPWVTVGGRSWAVRWSSTWARADCVVMVSPAPDGSAITAEMLDSPSLGAIRYQSWRTAMVRMADDQAGRGGGWSFSAFGFPFRAAVWGDWISGGQRRTWGQATLWRRTPPVVVATAPIWSGLIGNILVASACWLLLLRVPGLARGAVRRRRGRCPACGYDLVGELGKGCPECGWGRSIIRA